MAGGYESLLGSAAFLGPASLPRFLYLALTLLCIPLVVCRSLHSPPSEWTQLRMCHLLEDVSPCCVGKPGPENVAFGQQLQPLAEVLPLTGVAAGLYAAR